MRPVLVDSNVILDVVTEDAEWFTWSAATLAAEAERARLVINPVVYAEVSVGFSRIEDLEEVLPGDFFLRSPLPREATFLAGKAFLRYRRRGGTRRSPLPDYFIGAHAAVANLRLLTRDSSRYAAYFPGLEIISP